MRMTSAEANKLLKKLNDEHTALLNKEENGIYNQLYNKAVDRGGF